MKKDKMKAYYFAYAYTNFVHYNYMKKFNGLKATDWDISEYIGYDHSKASAKRNFLKMNKKAHFKIVILEFREAREEDYD